MLPTSARVEPATSWSPVGRASNCATEAGLSVYSSKSCPDIIPFMPSRLFYLNSLNRSISSKRGVLSVFIITMFYRNSCTKCKQCRPWSDAAFCGVWSGFTLFAERGVWSGSTLVCQCPFCRALEVNGLINSYIYIYVKLKLTSLLQISQNTSLSFYLNRYLKAFVTDYYARKYRL